MCILAFTDRIKEPSSIRYKEIIDPRFSLHNYGQNKYKNNSD